MMVIVLKIINVIKEWKSDEKEKENENEITKEKKRNKEIQRIKMKKRKQDQKSKEEDKIIKLDEGRKERGKNERENMKEEERSALTPKKRVQPHVRKACDISP